MSPQILPVGGCAAGDQRLMGSFSASDRPEEGLLLTAVGSGAVFLELAKTAASIQNKENWFLNICHPIIIVDNQYLGCSVCEVLRTDNVG